METNQPTSTLDDEPAVPAAEAPQKPLRLRGAHAAVLERPVRRFFLRFLAVLLVTVFLVLFAAYGVMFVLARGPSPTAQRLFVMSVRETSAAYFLADWFFTPEEIAAIESSGASAAEPDDTDTSLVQIGASDGEHETTNDYGLTDADGDGIILTNVSGPGYLGYMMVVLDPARMTFGSPSRFGADGLTVRQMAEKYDCVAGVNGGGFEDVDGKGTGGVPIGMTIVDGEIFYAGEGISYPFVGFDGDYILHTGQLTPADARERDIRFGCSFGPVLVSNGEPVSSDTLLSGVNPRTAIGQRADGAVLLLVIEGRQARSLGATYADLSDIMLQYGAVTACNLDGGSSSNLWFNGEYVNSSASLIGDRRIPTAFLVAKEAQE